MSDFYGAVRALSDAWNTHATSSASASDAGDAAAGEASSIFRLGVLAYYVSGPGIEEDSTQQAFSAGYGQGLRQAAAGWHCEQSLAAVPVTPSAIDGGVPERDTDRVAGVRAAYSAITDNAPCNRTPPTAEQRRRANVELQRFSDAR
jgi:hypothetical protein